VPSQVGPVKVVSSFADSMTLSWTPPSQLNGRITKYEVTWNDHSIDKPMTVVGATKTIEVIFA